MTRGDIQGKGQAAHHTAQEQGAGVPHEHLGGMEVIDQEGGQTAGHGGGRETVRSLRPYQADTPT